MSATSPAVGSTTSTLPRTPIILGGGGGNDSGATLSTNPTYEFSLKNKVLFLALTSAATLLALSLSISSFSLLIFSCSIWWSLTVSLRSLGHIFHRRAASTQCSQYKPRLVSVTPATDGPCNNGPKSREFTAATAAQSCEVVATVWGVVPPSYTVVTLDEAVDAADMAPVRAKSYASSTKRWGGSALMGSPPTSISIPRRTIRRRGWPPPCVLFFPP
mmetsp:Transcript_43740/g.133076  ORF Transcript_43740/g.133076 Transcript_43740/m.133076 type:complete len:217 (+) Transcript_43740:1828-2478(+)